MSNDRASLEQDIRTVAGTTRTTFRTGLALSGGGFRAALFHLGVLNYLADQRTLGCVDAISTVSGGSLVGGIYLLSLRARLGPLAAGAAIDHDLVADAVDDTTRVIMAMARRGLVFQTVLNPLRFARLYGPGVSMPTMIADVLDRELTPSGDDGPVRMDELYVPGHPVPEAEADANTARVPLLLINATTLNTGRAWRFGPHGMGEVVDVDGRASQAADLHGIDPLRPFAYGDRFPAPTLGTAMMASACFPPVLFPLELPDVELGDGRTSWKVRLTDGGVYDNQGVTGLTILGCDRMVVSDGAGQLDERGVPQRGVWNVAMRVQSVQGARLRVQTLHHAEGLARLDTFGDVASTEPLRPLCDGDGKLTIGTRPVASTTPMLGAPSTAILGLWPNAMLPIEVQDKKTISAVTLDMRWGARDQRLNGVDPSAQERVAGLRTHLNVFSPVERAATTALGYLVARHHRAPGSQLSSPEPRPRWHQLGSEVLSEGGKPGGYARHSVLRHLERGSGLASRRRILPRIKLDEPARVRGYDWRSWTGRGVLLSLVGGLLFAGLAALIVRNPRGGTWTAIGFAMLGMTRIVYEWSNERVRLLHSLLAFPSLGLGVVGSFLGFVAWTALRTYRRLRYLLAR